MATLAQGEARTIVANPAGPPSNSMSFALPPGVTISIESVLAAIDASGSGGTTALLEIADSSGAVIARKAQSQPVTGGVVGSATWALRLDDEATVRPAAAISLRLGGTVASDEPVILATVGANTAGVFGGHSYAAPAVTWTVQANAILELVAENLGADTIPGVFGRVWVQRLDVAQREQLSCGTGPIPAGGSDVMAISASNFGTSLIDFTNPIHPFFKTAGVYAVTLAATVT